MSPFTAIYAVKGDTIRTRRVRPSVPSFEAPPASP
jgi:hypothetical protein